MKVELFKFATFSFLFPILYIFSLFSLSLTYSLYFLRLVILWIRANERNGPRDAISYIYKTHFTQPPVLYSQYSPKFALFHFLQFLHFSIFRINEHCKIHVRALERQKRPTSATIFRIVGVVYVYFEKDIFF